MIKVRVKYKAQLRTVLQQAEEEFELPTSCSLTELLTQIVDQYPAGTVHLLNESGDVLTSLLLVVNDIAVRSVDAASVVLNDGDVVWLLPPIAGG